MKHENVFCALREEGPDYLHQDLKDPRLVDKVDPPDPEGEAAGEKRGGETDLVNTQVSEARSLSVVILLIGISPDVSKTEAFAV